jgi:hypothetical protein
VGNVVVGDQLTTNGVNSFGPAISTMAETHRGQVVLGGGYFVSSPTVSNELFASRYNANLTPDRSFGQRVATSDSSGPALYGVRLGLQSATDAIGELLDARIALIGSQVVVVTARGVRVQ